MRQTGSAARAGARVAAPLLGLLLLFGALLPGGARAQIGGERYASIALDHRTGAVLSAAHADEPRYPASLTKMMTLYMLFEAMRAGRIGLADRVVISEEAASRIPSKLGLPPGRSVSVEVAIHALVMKSANDVAVAVAETLAGSEPRFAQMMTLRARQLGMTRTVFRNASGLPDWDQTSTARDMALLGRRLLMDFPERWGYFGHGHARVGAYAFRSHNRLLGEEEGVDGVKTGYIHASGFNNVVSAQREGRRVFVAVFGGSSWAERDRHATMLLDDAFSRLGVHAPARAPLIAEAPAVLARQARAATAAAGAAVSVARRAPQPASVLSPRLAASGLLRDPPTRTGAREPLRRTVAAPPAPILGARAAAARPVEPRSVAGRSAAARPAAARPVAARPTAAPATRPLAARPAPDRPPARALAREPARRTAAFAPAAARSAAARPVASARPAAARVIEQGDGGRSVRLPAPLPRRPAAR